MSEQVDAPNPAIVRSFQVERQWRCVGDPCRYTKAYFHHKAHEGHEDRAGHTD